MNTTTSNPQRKTDLGSLFLRITITGAFLLMAVAAGLTLAACGGDDPECVGGQACVCQGDCAKSCGENGSGCTFECPAGATCTFDCAGGSCVANGPKAKSVVVNCPGNNCNVTCGQDTEVCRIESCQSACVLTCNGATECDNSCDMLGACTTSN